MTRPRMARGLAMGVTIAVAAVALRVVTGSEVGRDQIVFSYPAVLVATLLFGTTAGTTTAVVCVGVAWFLVIPPIHSFAIRDMAGFTTLAVDVLVSATLVVTIGTMKAAVARYHELTLTLEQRVRERTAERNKIWERSPEYIAICSPEGLIRTMNPSLEAVLPRSTSEGLNLFDLLEERDATALRVAIDQLASAAGTAALETTLLVPIGEIIVAWSVVQDETSLYLVGRNVTSERECNEQLRHSHKVEAIGQMTGGLAHDLANYLTPIAMSLELIRRRHPDDGRTADLVSSANVSADGARALVDRIMRFARREHSEPTSLNLREQLDSVAPLLSQTIGSRLLRTNFADDLPAVVIDAAELDSALLNLAANARDATRSGDPLTLSARRIDDHHVLIEFADTGVGMDAATVARAREPFFSTKPRGEGTGLGLAMVHDFARRAGGELSIDSELGIGSRIGIVLPVAG